MIKKATVAAFALTATLFVACDDKENSYNFAQIVYPTAYGSVVYADQYSDSLKFATTYDWSLTLQGDWLHIDEDSLAGTVPSGFYMVMNVMVQFDANTTDSTRACYILLNADGKSLMAHYGQYHYLNVTRPTRKNEMFQLSDTAYQTKDSIKFCTYSNDWTLAFKDETPTWVNLGADATTSGKAGSYTVALELESNLTTSERSAVLELQSRGVTTDIYILQKGKASE